MRILAVALAVIARSLFSASSALAASEPWMGSIRIPSATVYDAPGGTSLDSLPAGAQVVVSDWQIGPALSADNYTWARIGAGRFVHSSALRHAPLGESPPPPPRIVSTAHWADANLTEQVLTLYDGDHPVRWSLMTSGRPGPDTETHAGVWPIASRVFNETMRGADYDLAGVLFTQYFTADAEAIHLNYWLSDDERGVPRSHGCLGLAYDDAAFAWRFLFIDSLVFVHS